MEAAKGKVNELEYRYGLRGPRSCLRETQCRRCLRRAAAGIGVMNSITAVNFRGH